jgi:hypothetical protein
VDFYIVKTKFKERLRLRGYSNSYLDPIFQPTLDRQQIEDKVFKAFDTKKGMYSKSIRLYITVLLPKLQTPLSLRDFFRLPSTITTHPHFQQVYGNDPLIIGRQSFKNIGRLLAYKPINYSNSNNSRIQNEMLNPDQNSIPEP